MQPRNATQPPSPAEGAVDVTTEEFEPLFKLCISMVDEHNEPVLYKTDEGRGFGKEYTLRLVAGARYHLTIELDDLGGTVQALRGVCIDAVPMGAVQQVKRRNERDATTVFVISGDWTPGAAKTAKGQRDEVLIELQYEHGTHTRMMQFMLQMKVYQTEAEARSGGYNKRLKAAVCRYDKAKGVERWAVLEDTEFVSNRLPAQRCSLQ